MYAIDRPIAVYIGARMSALSRANDVLVSSTLRPGDRVRTHSTTAALTSSRVCPANGGSLPSRFVAAGCGETHFACHATDRSLTVPSRFYGGPVRQLTDDHRRLLVAGGRAGR